MAPHPIDQKPAACRLGMTALTVRCVTAASLILLSGLCATASAASGPVSNQLERQLRSATQQLLDAVAPGDVAVWKRYLHEDFLHVDEAGVVQSTSELLRDLSPLPAGLSGHITIDSFQLRLHGQVAITTHVDQEQLDYYGQMLHSRFRSTDTWLRTAQGWKLVAQQTMALLKDPPSVKLTSEQLCAYRGTYALTADITAQVECTEGGLSITRAGRAAVTYEAEVLDVFFAPGAPRSRRIFLRDGKGDVTGFADRREGEDVRWIKRP
jgi:ketosteroid isomerase-like protein